MAKEARPDTQSCAKLKRSYPARAKEASGGMKENPLNERKTFVK